MEQRYVVRGVFIDAIEPREVTTSCPCTAVTSAVVLRQLLGISVRRILQILFIFNAAIVFRCVVVRAGMRELLLKPHVFVRRPEFLMIWGVYTSTYITANTIITTCEQSQLDDRLPKFIGTSVVNITTCISKVTAVLLH